MALKDKIPKNNVENSLQQCEDNHKKIQFVPTAIHFHTWLKSVNKAGVNQSLSPSGTPLMWQDSVMPANINKNWVELNVSDKPFSLFKCNNNGSLSMFHITSPQV